MPGKPSKAETEKKKVVAEAQDGGAKAKKKAAPAKKAGNKAAAKKKSSGSKTDKKTKGTKSGPKRYFKLVDGKSGENIGRYVGSNPKQAASKAYTKFIKKSGKAGKKGGHQTTLYLRESSRGSNKKVYAYTAVRKALDEPQTREVTDDKGVTKTITNNFRNEIKKAAVPEELKQKGGSKKSKKSKSKSKATKKASGKKPAAKKTASKKPAAKKTDKKPAKKTSGSKTNKAAKTAKNAK